MPHCAEARPEPTRSEAAFYASIGPSQIAGAALPQQRRAIIAAERIEPAPQRIGGETELGQQEDRTALRLPLSQ